MNLTSQQRLIAALSIAFTCLYLYFETRYNRALLDLFSIPDPTKSVIDNLSREGKFLAAIGLCWALLRPAISKLQGRIRQVAAFIACVVLVYVGLVIFYDRVIAGLDAQTKVDGFHLAAYRKELLQGFIIDPDIPLPKTSAVQSAIVMTSFPLVMFDDRYMVPARTVLELKAGDISRYYLKKVDAAWPKYALQMRELRSGHEQYIDGSKKVEQISPIFKQRARQKFDTQSGGMTPNSHASMDYFLTQLRVSRSESARKLVQGEEEVVFIENEGTPRAHSVKGKDIPKFLSRDQFINHFKKKIDDARNEIVPTAATVEKAKGINDINAAVFVPPMAMVTSLISILTNLTGVIWIVLIGAIASVPKAGSWTNRLKMLTPVAVVGVVCTIYLMVPSKAFPPDTPMADLENKMQASIGWPGVFWSKSAIIQSTIYGNTHFLKRD